MGRSGTRHRGNTPPHREAERQALSAAVPVPDYLVAFDYGEWLYYVRDTGDLNDSFSPIGEPSEFVYERLWMHPIRMSALDESERDGGEETVERGPDGRWRPRYAWMTCAESTPGAVAFYGARDERPAFTLSRRPFSPRR